jgi:hypothetical protein
VNSLSATGDVTFIWATRGRTWGFRFLRRGGLPNPLAVYEATFAEVGDELELWRRVGDKVALRFPDPEGRRDAAGRVIPHDFVLLGSCVDGINSFEDAFQRIWHEVAPEFERVWERNEPPPAQE